MTSHRRTKDIILLFRKLIKVCTIVAVVLVFVTWVQVAALRFVNPPFTAAMVWEYARHLVKSERYQCPTYTWRPLEQISPHLQRAVLAGEDQRFLDHRGFDTVEIRAALKDILLEQRIRGASTISMQTARTVFLLPVRTVLRKVLEAYYTALIELLWDKRRILEVYLNTVDWGTGLMGAEAASLKYFKQNSNVMTPRQAALLVSVLPNPHRLSPATPSRYVKVRVKRILADMHRMPLL
jgi:monofunctional biosynthetic peptidoglycan transglycosylase